MDNLLRGLDMSTEDKARHKGEEIKGSIKEVVGKLTDDKSMEAEGKVEKWSGKVKGKVDDAVDDLDEDRTVR
ncbi:MAG: CsbD family protein [Propionibacteriaceae bacterium]